MLTPIRPEPGETCRNCGTTLLGPWCHECGQSLRSPVRELGALIVDGIQQVLNLDNKLFRSLLPLYFRPGWLTLRYLDGQRTNFVRPLRMYLGLSLVLFFAVALSIDVGDGPQSSGPTVQFDPFAADTPAAAASPAAPADAADAGTPADTRTADPEPAPTETARTTPSATTPPASTSIVPAELPEERRARIAKRIREATINFDGQPWDPVTHPLRFDSLPDAANDWLNRRVWAARERVIDYTVDPARFADAFIATLPTAMFVLLPLFALLLKGMYPFSGRLYVEHLIVALHSHSFLFFGFIGMLTLAAIGSWIPAISAACTNLILVGAAWMPLYLLLMQKRVYQQGWWMTLFKYSVIGTLYLILISCGLIGALLLSVLF